MNTEKKNMIPTTVIEIRSYTKQELCNLYGISKKILRQWLSDHTETLGSKFKKTFNAKEIEFIFKTFGYPKKIAL